MNNIGNNIENKLDSLKSGKIEKINQKNGFFNKIKQFFAKPIISFFTGLILGVTLLFGLNYLNTTILPLFIYKKGNTTHVASKSNYGMYFISNKAGESMAQKTSPGMGGSSYLHLFDVSDILRVEGLSLDSASREYSNSPDISNYKEELGKIKNLKVGDTADQDWFKYVNPTDRVFSVFTRNTDTSNGTDQYEMYTFKKETFGIKLLKISTYTKSDVDDFIKSIKEFQDNHKKK
jgi:hypothetical protein